MQKLQDSVFSIIKTTNLSPAVFSFLQPSEDSTDKTPLGGILKDTRHGWLALGSKLCIIDLKTGLKVAATTFGSTLSNIHKSVTCVVELASSLTSNSRQLIIGLECEDGTGMICIFHMNGSQILHCIQTDVIITQLSMCDEVPDGPFACFDGVVMAGTRSGEILLFDLNRSGLMTALKNISQGYEHLVSSESKPANISFLPIEAIQQIEEQRDLALKNNHNIAVIINEESLIDGQYIYCNPDGTVRMKAKRDHVKVSTIKYIPQLGSLAVGYNFGAFQIWNVMTLELKFSSPVNVECMPVTHFGFQEPCDDPRAFCYLWVVFSAIDQFEKDEFPLAVMYSLAYQGKRMMSESKYLYQDFLTANIRFQIDLSNVSSSDEDVHLYGGRCLSCHTYSVNSTLGEVGEDSVLNICHIVWECMLDNSPNSPPRYGMMLFDLDQWYKDQMPATHRLESNAFMSASWCPDIMRGGNRVLDVALEAGSVSPYSHATRLEEHFYPNSLQYNCVCLTTSDACVLSTIGIQRQIISSLDEVGPTALLNPPRLYNACLAAGLTPLYMDPCARNLSLEEQRSFLLSVALEARLSRLLKRCAHDWAAGTHASAGCTLPFLVDWCWKRAIALKENAREMTAPLFTSSALPDRNIVRCLEHCVQQLTQLTGLLDAVLTKCCNLIVPDALNEVEEKYKGIGTVSLYFQVTQWLLRVGLLPERQDARDALPYPTQALYTKCAKRRLKLHRLQDNSISDETAAKTPCALLYIDQLIEQEFGGDRIYQMWLKGGSVSHGLYPPPSLYSLLRLYLLPDIPEEHKHSLLLYLLVDYSMIYDEVRYETVTRKFMQFPTMFGLSNTAIKATLAFWHLDHREFDIALDQLQCLTGNTLSEWQHRVVLSSLLAQKKTQAALQYLHVRKPAPIQIVTRDKNGDVSLNSSNVNDHDKLDDWQSCCSLYLARRLVFEALDVIRMCVQNAGSLEEKVQVLNYFFKGCRNTGQLSKILEVTLLPFEEEAFIKYLQNCNEPQTSDILIMYYLQQARYLEAQQYNNKIKQSRARQRDVSTSLESLADVLDRDSARDTIVDVVCASLPNITSKVAHCALREKDTETRVVAPKPMSVFIQAKSPKNTFTYKSSFIQETIENASETWMNKPTMRRGIKRALNVEETPFICTPKLTRTVSLFSEQIESTPAKRVKLDFGSASKSVKRTTPLKVSDKLSQQMAQLLEMPEVQSPDFRSYDRNGAGTPHSILKIRSAEGLDTRVGSPVDSHYLGESDDEVMETASNHTHYSDTANKHLRFTIPTASESESPPFTIASEEVNETERPASVAEKDMDVTPDSFVTTTSRHEMDETHSLESPPKKLATEDNIKPRKSYKDTVRARRSLSISANSSLSDDPNASVESIADIPITLINPRYSGEKPTNIRSQRDSDDSVYETKDTIDLRERQRRSQSRERLNRSRSKENLTSESNVLTEEMENEKESFVGKGKSDLNVADTVVRVDVTPPRTPRGRRGIRDIGERTQLQVTRSRSVTPERHDSPIVTQLRTSRATRSRTPEVSPKSSPLDPIPEQPKQESESEPHPLKTTFSIPRQFRNRSRTPERTDKTVKEIQLEVIVESPTRVESPGASPRRSLRSRSRTPERIDRGAKVSPQLQFIAESPVKTGNIESPTSSPSKARLISRSGTPEVEILTESTSQSSPRSLRARSKTPERPMSPKPERSTRTKKPLSRIVLEANALAVSKQTETKDVTELITVTEKSDGNTDKAMECTPMKSSKETLTLMDVTFSPIVNKSVLQSPEMTIVCETSEKEDKTSDENVPNLDLKSIPAPSLSIDEQNYAKSVLHSYESSVAESSQSIQPDQKDTKSDDIATKVARKSMPAFATINESFYQKSVLHSYQSSIGETSHSIQEISTSFTKEIKPVDDNSSVNMKSVLKDVSSLITSDSDIEMRDDTEKDQWKAKIENQDTANVIRKEKEQIVEIEREINEIEGDMSNEDDDDQNDDGSSSSGDEEIIEPGEESTESENSDEDSSEDNVDEIISIDDSDSDASSQSNKELQIDEQTSTPEIPKEEKATETEKSEMEYITEVNVEKDVTVDDKQMESSVANDASTDPLNQGHISLMTDDNSVLQSDESDVYLHYSDESKVQDKNKEDDKDNEIVAKTDAAPVAIKIIVEEVASEEIVSKIDTESKEKVITKEIVDFTKTKVKPSETECSEHNKDNPEKESDKHEENEKTLQPIAQNTKRVKSTPSNKSTKSVENSEQTDETELVTEKLKTPKTRKRANSSASNKSSIETDQKTPEEDNTRSRSRSKTPQETRVIVTRRVSKEIAEMMDVSRDSLLDDSLLTPKRRATRSKSKNIDDNSSIASEGSVKSTKSKTKDEDKASQVRKSRKSIITAKPHLSVIPENTDETKVGDDTAENSGSGRLSRSQKSVSESKPIRRISTASRASSMTSIPQEADDDDDDEESSAHFTFDVQPIDRISLLNRGNYEGTLDAEEFRRISPVETIASDSSNQRRSRFSRAASESRALPIVAKTIRRVSVDIPESVESAVQSSGESPARTRRASFNRAIEALHTPKSRRASTELRRAESDSQPGSPATVAAERAATPTRRPRRASTASNQSASGKRSKN